MIGELIVAINSLKMRGQWVRHIDRTTPKSLRNPYFNKGYPIYQQQTSNYMYQFP